MTLELLIHTSISVLTSPPLLVLLAATGAWLVLMLSRALLEQNLQREAKLARLGGWFYLGLAVTLAVLPRFIQI